MLARDTCRDGAEPEQRPVTTISDKPSEGFSHCVTLSVAINSPPALLFEYLTDIENLSQFFPQVEFEPISKGPLKVGSIYHTRQKGAKAWSPYRVLALEPDALMSAELIGRDPLFRALRYQHRFIADGSETISHEKVEYTFRYGIAGRVLNWIIGRKLVKKQVLDAHLELKRKAEAR